MARLLQQAEREEAARVQAGNMPVVEERVYAMANFALGINDDNPQIMFDTPLPPGVKRHRFPFSWEALDKFIRDLQQIREEHGPKAE